ncbi:MAG: hypothetical protein IPL73_04615 [Candidatus Obscuribacter sp.]|nr:hypothetical protein [Candidatus Obscuribacter sp.]
MREQEQQHWYYGWCKRRSLALILCALTLLPLWAPLASAQGLELPAQPRIDEEDAEVPSLVSTAQRKSVAEQNASTDTVVADDDTSSGDSRATRPFAPPGDIKSLGLSLPGNDFMMPEGNVLKGRISADSGKSPILYGSVQSIPKNTKG